MQIYTETKMQTYVKICTIYLHWVITVNLEAYFRMGVGHLVDMIRIFQRMYGFAYLS